MRLIFYALLALNVVYFGWYQHQRLNRPAKMAQVEEQADTSISTLVLLTERVPEAKSAEPPPSISVPLVGNPKPGKVNSGSLSHQNNHQSVGVAVKKQPQAEVKPQTDVSTKVSGTKTGGAAPAVSSDQVCPYIGPFELESQALALSGELLGMGIRSVVGEVEIGSGGENWVYLPPTGGRKEALMLLRELQSKHVDSYLITEGELKNAISLGLFVSLESAEKLKSQMVSMGYDPIVRYMEKTRKEFWVKIDNDEQLSEERQLIEKVLSDHKDINFSETLCEMFAQEN